MRLEFGTRAGTSIVKTNTIQYIDCLREAINSQNPRLKIALSLWPRRMTIARHTDSKVVSKSTN